MNSLSLDILHVFAWNVLWIESVNPPLWFVSDKSFLFSNSQEAYGVYLDVRYTQKEPN